MNKVINKISKHCFWTKANKKRKEAKLKIKFLKSLDYKVILKKWEHNSWGDNICANSNGFYGCISNVRPNKGFTSNRCDLRNGDILIYEVDINRRHISWGKRYDVGCLVNIQLPGDPLDMFFANFLRICYTDDISDIKAHVKHYIMQLEQDL